MTRAAISRKLSIAWIFRARANAARSLPPLRESLGSASRKHFRILSQSAAPRHPIFSLHPVQQGGRHEPIDDTYSRHDARATGSRRVDRAPASRRAPMEDHCERDDQHRRPVRRAHPRRPRLGERALPAPVPCRRLFSGARRIVRSFAVPRRGADSLFTERGRRALSRAARRDAMELFHLSWELRMMDETYPRDMIGYGRTPPFADWPKRARIAVQFVINYEEGGENNILHGDAASEAFLSEIVGAAPWPGMRHMNMESIYEYGSRAGFWRLHRLFTERSVPVTVYAVATAMARNREAVAVMNEARWEIATHGLKWVDYRDTPSEIEALHIAEAVRIHTEIAGARPLGFYQGPSSINTIRLGMEEGGFVYCADTYADDLPYWLEGPRGPQLMTPYTLDANDMRFATAQGFNTGDQFYTYLKDSFDTLYDEGDVAPKMMSIGLHCRLVGRPGRARALARFLDYAQSHDRVWIPTRLDIARHWIAKHPPPGGWKPSELTRTLFIERFGGVYEHSPWIAATAYDAGLANGADTAEGLAKALAVAAGKGTSEQKRALIEAHPDLAGKLALAKTLTAESTREQTSAGLDRLTPDELRQFGELNGAYRAKFSFPFIMAVKGKSTADILAAFRGRLANDAEAETATALDEIDRIAALRLKDILP